MNLVILLPIYNDWDCLHILLGQLDQNLAENADSVQVLIVDDGSDLPAPKLRVNVPIRHISRVDCLRLRRNLGHQRAIVIGLTYIYKTLPCDAVLVMDADGEDKPEDAARLVRHLKKTGGKQVVFAERVRRSENLLFRVCYLAYRGLHWALTGIAVRFGNFGIVPFSHLEALSVVSESWNHYAASIIKARIPFTSVPTNRGNRIMGQSKLNFVGLVAHGLSAISVFSEVVGVRAILFTLLLVSLALVLLVAVVGIRVFTLLAIPAWATNAIGLVLVIVLQMLAVAVSLTLAIFFSRNSFSFLPVRDYQYFVGGVQTLYERQQ